MASPWPREEIRPAADRAGAAAAVDGGMVAAAGHRVEHLLPGGGEDRAQLGVGEVGERAPGVDPGGEAGLALEDVADPGDQVWSSRASPTPAARLGAASPRPPLGSKSAASMSGPRRASWGSRRRRSLGSTRRVGPPNWTASCSPPASTAQADARRPAPGSAAAVEVPAAAHPQVAVQGELAEVEQQVLAARLGAARSVRAVEPLDPGGAAARVRRARPRPPAPASAASRRRASRRIVSPSAMDKSCPPPAADRLRRCCEARRDRPAGPADVAGARRRAGRDRRRGADSRPGPHCAPPASPSPGRAAPPWPRSSAPAT